MLMRFTTESASGTEADYKAWTDFAEEAKKAGVMELGFDLQPPNKAGQNVKLTILKLNTNDTVRPGGYIAKGKQAGGFYVLATSNDAAAIATAKNYPPTVIGARQFTSYD